MYYVDKRYGHELGLSTCFRQPGASSHCRDPHGYPLAFHLRFGAKILDPNNWVMDFGGLKAIKAGLAEDFDHRTILAEDDPALDDFQAFYARWGFKPPLVIPFVGCEGFARYQFNKTNDWLRRTHADDVEQRMLHVKFVTVAEHGGNSATFEV